MPTDDPPRSRKVHPLRALPIQHVQRVKRALRVRCDDRMPSPAWGQRTSSPGSSRIGSIYVMAHRRCTSILVYPFRSAARVHDLLSIADMEHEKDTRQDDRPTNSDTASDLTSFLEQRVRILLDQSTSTQHSSSSNDVVFRVAQDRRRSPTNILPYRQRRGGDQKKLAH